MTHRERFDETDWQAPDVRSLLPLVQLLARIADKEAASLEPPREPAAPSLFEVDVFSKKAWNARDLTEITGFYSRYWTGKAAAGEVPGAVQVAGNGGKWSFEPARFMAWWRSHEARPPHVPDVKQAPSQQRHSAAAEKLANLLEGK